MGVAAREPTMEDILASIRKIVSQDAAPDAASPPPRPAAEPAPPIEASAPVAVAAEPVIVRPVSRGSGSFASFAKSVTSGEISGAPQAAAPQKWVAPGNQQAAAPAVSGQPAQSAAPAAGSLSGVLQSVRQSWPQNDPARAAAPRAALLPSPEPAPQRRELAQLARSAPGATPDPLVEAFKGALVSPGTENAVGGSLDRLKQGVMNNMDAKIETVLRPMLREWLDQNLPRMVEKMVRAEIDRIAKKS